MDIEIRFTGESSAKGRNGYFQLRRATLTKLDGAIEPAHPWVVDLYSSREPKGNMGPVVMQLTTEDVRRLVQGLNQWLGHE